MNSPQILLSSGIGPREDLNAVGVPVVHDLPGVGKNLHNHVAYALAFTINDTDTTPLNWATAMEYLLFRDGLMSGTGKERGIVSPFSLCYVYLFYYVFTVHDKCKTTLFPAAKVLSKHYINLTNYAPQIQ